MRTDRDLLARAVSAAAEPGAAAGSGAPVRPVLVGKAEPPDRRHLRILGIRGVPAEHGGFETFAEKLALFLVARGWQVTVYCQHTGDAPISHDTWRGIHRVNISVRSDGPVSTMAFDALSIRHAAQFPQDLCLTLGYNTASFCAWLRLRGVTNLINMDGIEWRRAKWGRVAKAWFWLNERAGCWLGDHLVADHPAIEAHLRTRIRASKITMISYGADRPAPDGPADLSPWGLMPGHFLTVIARPEPENTVLQIVQGFSARRRGMKLLVLGQYDAANPYHQQVRAAASDEVVFAGAIYDRAVVSAMRHQCMAYVHGHQVGGTNPSLVEALAAGNPVFAHDNRFNRWVAGDAARYFSTAEDFDIGLSEVLERPGLLTAMRRGSTQRFDEAFSWEQVLGSYEQLLLRFLPQTAAHAAKA